MESPNADEGQQKRYQTFRSNASANWRVKDENPRPDPQPRYQQRSFDQRRENGGSQAQEAAPSSRLYVGNLLYSAQSKDVEQLFTENGFTVAQISMSTDPFTGRNPSYCFVDLETADEANRAMSELNGKDVLGRAVRINLGVAKKSFGNGPRLKNYDRNDRWGQLGDTKSSKHYKSVSLPTKLTYADENYKPTFDRWSRTDASDHWKGASDKGRRLYVGGLPRMEPQSAVDAEMQKLFEGFELTAVSKIISPHVSKASTPGDHFYLFVDLPTSTAADAAVQALDGKESPWGGKLRINKARGDSRRVTKDKEAE
jgi:RNA recognition motif. (a.k.a. RRM, RBD, or RNP domain)